MRDAKTDPTFRRFCFYAACIVRLRLSSVEAPTTLLAYLSSLLPQDTCLFPRLQELSWVESYLCMSSRNITTFLSFSHISILTLRFQDQPPVTVSGQGRDFFANAVVELLAHISTAVPALRELTLHAPSTIPIPASAVLRFDILRRANLHISLAGTSTCVVVRPSACVLMRPLARR